MRSIKNRKYFKHAADLAASVMSSKGNDAGNDDLPHH